MFRYLIGSILLIAASDLFGQTLEPLEPPSDHVRSFLVTNPAWLAIPISSDSPITALVIKSASEGEFYVRIGNDRLSIPPDHDSESFTYFISLPTPANELSIEGTSSTFRLYLISSGSIEAKDYQPAREDSDHECGTTIEYIPQSVWREGLTAPFYSRSFHEVEHTIVHHSAGSNSSTNYTQVVRDIYLFHTEVNGWSDIGYNYLIAQNGDLYAGRDPGGGDQDRVRGAHFCGKNTGTLGVCLLGNYETAIPTVESWSTLENFLLHEMVQLELQPREVKDHRSIPLTTVAGHRDGCATLCPGEHVYTRLEELRTSLEQALVLCEEPLLAFEVDTTAIEFGDKVVFTNQSTGYEDFQWFLEGVFPETRDEQHEVAAYYYNEGSFDVILSGARNGTRDSLVREDFISVQTIPLAPVIYPNPAGPADELNLDFDGEILEITIFSLKGDLMFRFDRDAPHQVPILEPGMYLVKITSERKSFFSRLIVEQG